MSGEGSEVDCCIVVFRTVYYFFMYLKSILWCLLIFPVNSWGFLGILLSRPLLLMVLDFCE
jgi:hypothetical protein